MALLWLYHQAYTYHTDFSTNLHQRDTVIISVWLQARHTQQLLIYIAEEFAYKSMQQRLDARLEVHVEQHTFAMKRRMFASQGDVHGKGRPPEMSGVRYVACYRDMVMDFHRHRSTLC